MPALCRFQEWAGIALAWGVCFTRETDAREDARTQCTMSNPTRPPREPVSDKLDAVSLPDAYMPEGFARVSQSLKDKAAATAAIAELDMEPAPSIYISARHCRVPALQLRAAAGKKPFLCAQAGEPRPRMRSKFGHEAATRAFKELPLKWGGLTAERSAEVVYAQAGTASSLMRIVQAYPKRGPLPDGLLPITPTEARMALQGSGLVRRAGLPPEAWRPYPLLARESGAGLMVNPHADNGSPVLGKWDTPGASQEVWSLAQWFRSYVDSRQGFHAKVQSVRELELSRPDLTVCMGKTKADYYKIGKVVEGRMRFYNVLPRQVVLVMQQATQVLEGNSFSILRGSRTGIGMSLTHGGAAELVAALERQLEHGSAFVHVGDDSWVVLRVGDDIVMFALDCSNFDLTQRAEVTLEVHKAIAEELAKIDETAAAVWYAYARERLVLLHQSIVCRWRHAGPSGMPMQSKVNDMLMDVMIMRALRTLEKSGASQADVEEALQSAGRSMGFDVRVEQYSRVKAPSLAAALEVEPFLFIGYYFYAFQGNVACHADVPRTLAQVRTPTNTWERSGESFVLKEAMRLGSIALNLGVPSPDLELAFHEFREYAKTLLERAIQLEGDVSDPRLRWAAQIGAFGAEEATLRGLLRAVRRSPGLLWLQPPVRPEIQPLGPVIDWAEEAELEEASRERELGAVLVRPAGFTVPRIKIPLPHAPMRPATVRNLGRPPPIAWWEPDRPKFIRLEGARGRTGRVRREHEPLSDFEEDEDFSDDFDAEWEAVSYGSADLREERQQEGWW